MGKDSVDVTMSALQQSCGYLALPESWEVWNASRKLLQQNCLESKSNLGITYVPEVPLDVLT